MNFRRTAYTIALVALFASCANLNSALHPAKAKAALDKKSDPTEASPPLAIDPAYPLHVTAVDVRTFKKMKREETEFQINGRCSFVARRRKHPCHKMVIAVLDQTGVVLERAEVQDQGEFKATVEKGRQYFLAIDQAPFKVQTKALGPFTTKDFVLLQIR